MSYAQHKRTAQRYREAVGLPHVEVPKDLDQAETDLLQKKDTLRRQKEAGAKAGEIHELEMDVLELETRVRQLREKLKV